MTLVAASRASGHRRMPWWLGWSIALVLALGFCVLGRWQVQRMYEKQALLAQAAHVRDRPQALADALRTGRAGRLAWVHGAGRFLPGQILLDNQIRQGRSGVKVYQPFLPDGVSGPVLVELGWLPLPADRALPSPVPLQGRYVLAGLLGPPPSHGLALGPALVAAPSPQRWLAMRIEPAAIGLALGRRDILSQVLRLDPALPLGYPRDLDLLPNTLPPERHLAYAVQWFGLALLVLVTTALLSWRAYRGRGGR
ncbi:SURF1 family protein [Xanthomonas sp. MUS 060]|uniref:SURF1 family protein n=1 Tax=Xanthomonas sp. MUS 060 TaxID=1588031 RepID=UPI0005F285BD|nr:SURF1 family protein [Xanthomonas sp. MUS 060]